MTDNGKPMIVRMFPAIALLLLFGTTTHVNSAEIEQLDWLGGCWKSENADAGSGEHWLPLAGDVMFGISRTVRQGRTVAFEFMQIRATEEGQLAFIAMPSGQQTTVFPLLRLGETEAVFENLQHDFPHRVIYQLDGQTRLMARIEGISRGAPRVIEFPMQRVSCDLQFAGDEAGG